MVNLYFGGCKHHLFQLPHLKKPQGIPRVNRWKNDPMSSWMDFPGLDFDQSLLVCYFGPRIGIKTSQETIGIRHTVERKIRSTLVKWPILLKNIPGIPHLVQQFVSKLRVSLSVRCRVADADGELLLIEAVLAEWCWVSDIPSVTGADKGRYSKLQPCYHER